MFWDYLQKKSSRLIGNMFNWVIKKQVGRYEPNLTYFA